MYWRVGLLAIAVTLFGSADCLAGNAQPMTVQVQVICPSTPMAKRLLAGIDAALTRDHYARASIWPDVRLLVFAMPDLENRTDPRGWSFAIAQAATSPLLMAVPALLKSKHSLRGFIPGPRLAAIFMHSTGILTYLNVMNVDHLDARNFNLVVGTIVNTFTSRWPPVIGGHVHPQPLPQEPRSFRASPRIFSGSPADSAP